MKELLSIMLSFPPQSPKPHIISDADYDQQIRSLCSNLKQVPYTRLVGDVSEDGSFLELLDPARQSLAYLFVILAHYHALQTKGNKQFPDSFQPGGEMWWKSVTFLKVFDPIQVRYAGHEWRKVVELVARGAETVSRPLLAIYPIKHALLRLDPSCSTFTSSHVIFTRLCLQAREYRCALQIINKDICHFPTTADRLFLRRSELLLCGRHESSMSYITTATGLSGRLTHRHYLEYFLYGGMIYIGLKQWDNALHFLNVVITVPTNNSVSLIMVEAYKKRVLVCLLERGMPLPIPKSVAPHAAKAYRSLAKPYDVLAEIFRAGDLQRLMAEINVGQSVWHIDNNTGLVLQVLAAFRRFSILKLERTFAALSIPDIAHRIFLGQVNSEEAEIFVASLISTGRLKASLVQSPDASSPTILRFTSSALNSGLPTEVRIRDDLIAQKSRLEILMENVQGTNIKLELGREYIDTLRKRRKDSGGRDGISAENTNNEFDIDEDMMGDLQ